MINSLNFTVIDFQTANSSPLSACYFTILRVEEGEIVDTYKTYIKPIPFKFNSKMHGNEMHIEDSMGIKSPSFKDIFKKIQPWLDKQIIVSHRVSYIKNVLHNLLEWYKLEANVIDYLSSLEIARVDLPFMNDPNIQEVYMHFFNASLKMDDPIAVAEANAKVVIRIFEDWNPPSFEKMISALYGQPAGFRTNIYGKVRLRSLYTDPNYKFLDKTELQGTGFTFLSQVDGMSKSEVSNFILSYGGKLNERVLGTTTHVILKGDDLAHASVSDNSEMLKALDTARANKDISILSDKSFFNLVQMIKEQEEKSKLVEASFNKS